MLPMRKMMGWHIMDTRKTLLIKNIEGFPNSIIKHIIFLRLETHLTRAEPVPQFPVSFPCA